MNMNRRHLLRLAALSTPWAVAGQSFAASDRAIVDKAFWSGKLTCDNAGVPVSDRSTRLATPADFDASRPCTMLEDSAEGPFFVCTNPGTADIAQGKPGAPLVVAFRAVNAATCRPIADAVIDVWHCDALGLYSGQALKMDQTVSGSRYIPPVTGERFCRGVLRTDADGIAEFRSIYPGYYIERAIHIHFKVHVGNRAFLTNQALLPENANAAVQALSAYVVPRSKPRIMNSEEASWGLPTMQVLDRGPTRLALLTLAVSV